LSLYSGSLNLHKTKENLLIQKGGRRVVFPTFINDFPARTNCNRNQM
jgi:hypothetical protein